jgi:hypothetical protein
MLYYAHTLIFYMHPEQSGYNPEGRPELADLSNGINSLLNKARERLAYLKGFEITAAETTDFRGERKQSKIERIKTGTANELEIASHKNVSGGIETLERMIERLEAASKSISAGSRAVGAIYKVEDIVSEERKNWEENFEIPNRE